MKGAIARICAVVAVGLALSGCAAPIIGALTLGQLTTIAGLVIHEARSIPDVGQSFTFHGFRFSVMRKQRNRIMALRITPLVRKPTLMARAS